MARRSSDEMARLTVRVPRGHDGFWTALRALARDGSFTLGQLEGTTNVQRDTVRDYLKRLERAGIVACVATLPGVGNRQGAGVYHLVRDPGPEAPRLRRDGTPVTQGRAQENMWRAMKMLGAFTSRELAVAAATEDCPVPLISAQSYVSHLARAGYLAKVAGRGPIAATWRLLPRMHTGPAAPQIQRTDWVWDPNLKRVVGPEAAP